MRHPKIEAFAAAFLLASATAASAGWRDMANPVDQQRLSRLDEARAKGLDEASRGAPAADLAAIHAVSDAQGGFAPAAALTGSWRCRTIKLGGMTPDVIYGWFNCRIADHGDTLTLEKTSGSQRMAGTLYPDGGRYVYLGATSMKGEPVHRYSGNGAFAGAAATPDDQIGALTVIGPGHARLELPYPLQESTFDILELKR